MSNNKNNVKNQHYVPACYLANFGVNGNQGRNSTVYYYNFKNQHSGIANVNTFPKEAYFYDIEELGDDKQIIEKAYCQFEGDYSDLLKEVLLLNIEKGKRVCSSLALSIEKKDILAAHFALQIERSKAIREYFKTLYQKIKSRFTYAGIPDYDENDFKRLHINSILNGSIANFYANLFSDRKWIFLVNHTDIPFITSDNPCIQINHVKDIRRESISPASKKVTHYIPLSPSLAVEIYEKSVIQNDLSYFDIYRKEHVFWYNLNLKEQCTMYLFSNKNDFSYLIEEDL